MGLSRSPRGYFHIVRGIEKDLARVDKEALHRAIKNLYKSKLIGEKTNKDGTITLVITQKGKEKALKYNIDKIKIPKMEKWDKKWRVVLFDIPENKKKARDALRWSLKKARFYEFQKSVFVHPYSCKNELDYLIEYFNIRPYVRMMLVEKIDNELHLKSHFSLPI
jgi:DNA-binding transcriptional regulator PaaX